MSASIGRFLTFSAVMFAPRWGEPHFGIELASQLDSPSSWRASYEGRVAEYVFTTRDS